jgi:hypothetical protein
VILVALAIIFAAHRRRQSEMRAPAAVTGTLLAEQILEIRPMPARHRRYRHAHSFLRPAALPPDPS